MLLACQGQLRLAPSGHVIGIDMDAALTLAAAREYDLAVLSELLPPAQAGFVEALGALKLGRRHQRPVVIPPRSPRCAAHPSDSDLLPTGHRPPGTTEYRSLSIRWTHLLG